MRSSNNGLLRCASWLGVFFLLICQQGDHDPATTPNPGSPAYLARGREVEHKYRAYRDRLARYYDQLAEELRRRAPDIMARLQPPAALPQGYQVLPLISPDAPALANAATNLVAYSWPWTERLIRAELRHLARAEKELRQSRSGSTAASRSILGKLAADYAAQSRRHQLIDAHVQYNRLWQAAIAEDRASYDRATALQFQVLEHRKLAGKLSSVRTKDPPSPVTPATHAGSDELTTDLRQRAAVLAAHIDQAFTPVNTPDFMRVSNVGDEWIVSVPLFTDITDEQFVTEAKRVIETAWRASEGSGTFRVELDVVLVSPESLYDLESLPRAGQALNVRDHVARFPDNGAILTTGGATTHVRGHAIILGPHALPARILAHEFGHILGFRDRYIRGYKNLGQNGFQVLELVTNPQDIMASTPGGSVLPAHFHALLKQHRSARGVPALKPVGKPPTRTET